MQLDAASQRAGRGPAAFTTSPPLSSKAWRHPVKSRARASVLQLSAHSHPNAGTTNQGLYWGLGYDSVCSVAPSNASKLSQQPARRSRKNSATACQALASTPCTAGCGNGNNGVGHSRRQPGTKSTNWCPRRRNKQSEFTRGTRSLTACASLAFAEPAASAVASAAVASGGFSLSNFVAVGLGYAVLAGSLFRSVPQILKVLQHQSTEGLSLTSYIVELCCYSVSIAYNISQGYGFNTFGEVVACWLQDIVIIALIFRFSCTKKWAAASATGVAVALGCAWLLSPFCPLHVLAFLQASNIVVMALGSRLPQILLNMRRGNAGVLSVMTCLLNVAGNTARIFTTVVLTGDVLLMAGYFSQGTLNSILLCQSIGTSQQKRRTEASGSSSAVASQRQQELLQPLHIGPAGQDPGSPGGFIMQPAAG